MRLVAIGDVGVVDDMIHIGDEAMFEQFVDRIRARGAERIVGLSSAPAETADRYAIQAVGQVRFAPGGSRAEYEDRLDRVIRAAKGETGLVESGDDAHAVIDAIRDADGVAITGGGNLASIWPTNIFGRAAIAGIARALGTPLVISGQTLGPELSHEDRVLVGELLRGAALVGVREPASFRVARSLGVTDTLQLTVDDASFLGGSDEAPSGDYCAVTISTHLGGEDPDRFFDALAALLDEVHSVTGLEIAFLAHYGSLTPTDRRGDARMHDAVAARMTAPSRHERVTDSLAAAAFSRAASLSFTSRYHPAVFAVAAGVPTVGMPVDEYTTVKLAGALGNFGQRGVVPIASVFDGSATESVLAVWNERAGIRSRGLELAKTHRLASEAWWDRMAAVFRAP